MVALLAQARITPADVDRFSHALGKLVESFSAADGERGESYHLNVCLYPGDINPSQGQRIR